MHEVNSGYQSTTEVQVKKANGVKIVNLLQLKQLIDGLVQKALLKRPPGTTTTITFTTGADGMKQEVREEWFDDVLILELEDKRIVVLNVAEAAGAHQQLLDRHRIPAYCSPDLLVP